jgi:BMFP domain-containing protein YqiC
MQCLKNPSQINLNNLDNVGREVRIHIRNRKEYLKAKIEELETNSKTKNIRTCIGPLMTLRKVTNLEII